MMTPRFSIAYLIEYLAETAYHKAGEKSGVVVLDVVIGNSYTFVNKDVADHYGNPLHLCDDAEAFFVVELHEIDNESVKITEV